MSKANLYRKSETDWDCGSLPKIKGFYWIKTTWGDVEVVNINYVNEDGVGFEVLGYEGGGDQTGVIWFYGPLTPPNFPDKEPRNKRVYW